MCLRHVFRRNDVAVLSISCRLSQGLARAGALVHALADSNKPRNEAILPRLSDLPVHYRVDRVFGSDNGLLIHAGLRPASILNHKSIPRGIPSDSLSVDNALVVSFQ
jgi:hypothetical protein